MRSAWPPTAWFLPILLLGLQGCAALALPVGTAAVSAGTGSLVEAGASYTMGGATYRTFPVPLADLYGAVRMTLARLGFAAPRERIDRERVLLEVDGIDRSLELTLQPITPALTQLAVAVRRAALGRDPATASELIARTEAALADAGLALTGAR